jgi:hypothetical protein
MINEETFYSVMRVLRENINDPERLDDIMDSFSANQRECKMHLLDLIDELAIIDEESNVVIWGSWYGSIFTPNLAPKVKSIACMDMDQDAIDIAIGLFHNLENVDQIVGDIFEKRLSRYSETDLVINTSCEHMPPLKEHKHLDDFKAGTFFALQSNNMFSIDQHTNCVHNLEEFKEQLPKDFKILYSDSIKVPGWEDEDGTRFTIIAQKIC